jgi:tRNA (guanosine-2'-O-)-methyltransferase
MSRVVDPESLLLPRRIARIDEVVARRVRGLTVVLESVHDPHNLAAVLRTAEGLGLQDVHIVEGPRGFRPSAAVTQGADKWLDLHRHADVASCVAALRATGHCIYGSLLSDSALDLEAVPFEAPVALVFGNEHAGLSRDFEGRCDGSFRIPMGGFAQSFNVSVAVGISLATAMLARRRQGLGGDLSATDQDTLKRRFYALSADLP